MSDRDHSALLVELEAVLVQEFRLYQRLLTLAQDERRALTTADLSALTAALHSTEAIYAELTQLESQRRQTLEQWAQAGQTPPPASLAEMLPRLEAAAAQRLNRLREGILALAQQLRDLGQGNRALAVAALERVDELRRFLLTLAQAPAGYAPPGQTVAAPVVVALSREQWA
jgi:flagellar biosynthesis/type III secretory pathway chaperone